MIVVMDNGYAQKAVAAATPAHGERPGPHMFDFRGFEEVLLGELIPKVDASYRTIADSKHRAMAGLSMGAMQTMQIRRPIPTLLRTSALQPPAGRHIRPQDGLRWRLQRSGGFR